MNKYLINWELLANIHEDSEEMNKSEKFEKKVDKFGWECLKLGGLLALLALVLFLLPIISRM